MSIRAIVWAFNQKTGSSASKLVLIKLADNANDEGRCYPSLAYIAKHCEMHRATVIRHISALSQRGFVDVEHRSVEGSKIPNVYHLKMQPVVADCDQGSRTLKPGVVATCDQGSRTLRHRTVIEPSVKPSVNLIDTHQPKSAVDARAKGSRLSNDWTLSQELGDWALAEGLARDRLRQEADRFRDYWIAKPGAAGRKTDWPATWRNWVRRATENKTGGHNGTHRQNSGPLSAVDRVNAAISARARERDQREAVQRGGRTFNADGAVMEADDRNVRSPLD